MCIDINHKTHTVVGLAVAGLVVEVAIWQVLRGQLRRGQILHKSVVEQRVVVALAAAVVAVPQLRAQGHKLKFKSQYNIRPLL